MSSDPLTTPDTSTAIPRTLPRGPHRLAREVVAASQRWRMVDAMAQAVAEKGYGPVTVADVIGRAGVSRKTFYEHFRDKEDCFLAAYDAGVEVLLATVREAGDEASDPVARVRAQIRAFLETLAAEPAFARTFLIEVGAAGPRALDRRRRVHAQFAALIRETAQTSGSDVSTVPDDVWLAVIGATNEVVANSVHRGRTAQLPALEETILRIQLALLGSRGDGPAAARPTA